MTAGADFAMYVSLDTMIFQAIRAILLASAMAASFDGLRLRSSVSQADAFTGSPGVLNDRRCPDYQRRSQCLITRSRDAAEAQLAAGRVILRRQPDPSCELAARLE